MHSVPPPPASVPDPDLSAAKWEARWVRVRAAAEHIAGSVKGLALASMAAAGLLWWVLCGAIVWPLGWKTALAVVVLGLLLVPALAAWSGYGILKTLLAVPDALRARAHEAARVARLPLGGSDDATRTEGFFGRIAGLIGVVTLLRGLIVQTRDVWTHHGQLLRLVNLGYVLMLLGAFALNFVLIPASVVAFAVWLLVRGAGV